MIFYHFQYVHWMRMRRLTDEQRTSVIRIWEFVRDERVLLKKSSEMSSILMLVKEKNTDSDGGRGQ